MGPEPPESYDPYRGVEPEGVDPQQSLQILVDYLRNVEEFMDFVFANPPAAIRGTWLDRQEAAWHELRERLGDGHGTLAYEIFTASKGRPGLEDGSDLDAHGLRGRPLFAKINEWRDKSRAFLQLRNTSRLAKALRTAGVITESIAECMGVGGAYKEAIKGLNHLTDIAVEEGA